MTDLAELKRLAERLRNRLIDELNYGKSVLMSDKPRTLYEDIRDADLAILSLIAEVEEAKGLLDYAEDNSKIEWAEAQAEGFRRGIEAAAKVADGRADAYAHFANKHEGSPIGDSNTMRCGAASSIAAAIRAIGAAGNE